jgi:Tfp pilus assembly protein PilF
MRALLVSGLILALFAGAVSAAGYPPNQQPMYGGIARNLRDRITDQAFLNSVAKMGYTRASGSDKSVDLGWQYFFRPDLATAMMRFNQAWLQDPDNGDAFHGFALVVVERDHDAAAADLLFRQGIAKPRQKPGIFLDYGRFLLMQKRPADAVPLLEKALSFPDMGPDAQALYALALFESGRQPEACAAANKVQDGAQPNLRDSARSLLAIPACRQAG